MKQISYKIKGDVWLYSGAMASWHFVCVGEKISEEIKKGYPFLGKKGFGSVPVFATIGKTQWKSSIFPDKKRNSYILPIKKEIREKEDVFDGKNIYFTIKILM